MKIIAGYWLMIFAMVLVGPALFGPPDFSTGAFTRAALVSTLFAPAGWARWHWAPEFYRKRQKRKALERLP